MAQILQNRPFFEYVLMADYKKAEEAAIFLEICRNHLTLRKKTLNWRFTGG
jgi:hypothetical protein